MRYIKLLFVFVIIVAVLVLGVAFTVLNEGNVTLNYHWGTISLPLPAVVLASIFLGAVLGWFVSLGKLFKAKKENFGLKRQAKATSEELRHLRTIPLKDQ